MLTTREYYVPAAVVDLPDDQPHPNLVVEKTPPFLRLATAHLCRSAVP